MRRASVALIVQIHLLQNRTDLALKEVKAARNWAQDNLLVNIAESWVGLRVVSSPERAHIGPCRTLINLGRREVPTGLLRVRRDARLPVCRGDTPRTTARGGGSSPKSPARKPRRHGRHRQFNRPQHLGWQGCIGAYLVSLFVLSYKLC
jgi:hypothetical protein